MQILPFLSKKLVAQYKNCSAFSSREVCRDAARPLLAQIPVDEVPAVLR